MGDLIDYEDRYYLEDLKLYDQKFAEEHNIDDNTVFVIKETMLMFICDSRSKRVDFGAGSTITYYATSASTTFT